MFDGNDDYEQEIATLLTNLEAAVLKEVKDGKNKLHNVSGLINKIMEGIVQDASEMIEKKRIKIQSDLTVIEDEAKKNEIKDSVCLQRANENLSRLQKSIMDNLQKCTHKESQEVEILMKKYKSEGRKSLNEITLDINTLKCNLTSNRIRDVTGSLPTTTKKIKELSSQLNKGVTSVQNMLPLVENKLKNHIEKLSIHMDDNAQALLVDTRKCVQVLIEDKKQMNELPEIRNSASIYQRSFMSTFEQSKEQFKKILNDLRTGIQSRIDTDEEEIRNFLEYFNGQEGLITNATSNSISAKLNMYQLALRSLENRGKELEIDVKSCVEPAKQQIKDLMEHVLEEVELKIKEGVLEVRQLFQTYQDTSNESLRNLQAQISMAEEKLAESDADYMAIAMPEIGAKVANLPVEMTKDYNEIKERVQARGEELASYIEKVFLRIEINASLYETDARKCSYTLFQKKLEEN